uniref:Uncharacterized protein n=1 Tax=Mesocestoides corti TaxID=53468 RepID=A0A5K3G558_MESCO
MAITKIDSHQPVREDSAHTVAKVSITTASISTTLLSASALRGLYDSATGGRNAGNTRQFQSIVWNTGDNLAATPSTSPHVSTS